MLESMEIKEGSHGAGEEKKELWQEKQETTGRKKIEKL